MLHAFVDESYCDDWFFMAAAIASDEQQLGALERGIADVLAAECERLAMDLPREVHGYEMFQGVGPWAAIDLHERLGVAGRVLQAVRKSEVVFILRGLDRAAQRRRYRTAYEPYPLVLTHIMRAIHAFAEDRGEEVRITCDEIHHDDRHRAMLERHRTHGTPGYNSTRLGSVVEELNFVDSASSHMVQAADVVAYLKHRIVSRPSVGRPERRARTGLWRIIDDRIEHDYCWTP